MHSSTWTWTFTRIKQEVICVFSILQTDFAGFLLLVFFLFVLGWSVFHNWFIDVDFLFAAFGSGYLFSNANLAYEELDST